MAWADAEDERDVSGAVGEKGPTWLPVVGQFGIRWGAIGNERAV